MQVQVPAVPNLYELEHLLRHRAQSLCPVSIKTQRGEEGKHLLETAQLCTGNSEHLQEHKIKAGSNLKHCRRYRSLLIFCKQVKSWIRSDSASNYHREHN